MRHLVHFWMSRGHVQDEAQELARRHLKGENVPINPIAATKLPQREPFLEGQADELLERALSAQE